METGDESVLTLREECCILHFVKDYVHLTYKDDDLFRNGSPRMIMPENLQNEQVHARSREITNKPLPVRTTKTL